jgi:DHA1 family bicyclomycin/chloramphenicol resistance-like MFS transporter
MPRPDSLAVTVLLAALTAFLPISTDLYLASLPELTRVFHADVAEVQLTLSVFLVGFAVSQLAYGSLSDRFGRRPVLLLGTGLYFVATVACVLAPSIEALIAARFFQAVGACSAPVLARAVVRDVHEPKHAARILSHIGTAMALAPMVGPILGSYLTVWLGWRANFVLLAGFGGLSFAAVALMLRETNAHKDPQALNLKRIAGYLLTLLGERAYLGYVLTAAAVYSGLFAFLSGSSFVLIQVLGVPTEHFGLYFAIVVLGYMLGTQIAGRRVMRFGIERIARAGTWLGLASGILIAALGWAGVAHVAAVIGPQFLFMVAVGMVLPNSMAGAIGPFPHMAGLASAFLGFVQMGAAALVGIAVGQLNDGTQVPMTSATGAMGCATFIVFALLVWRRRARREAV